MYNCIYDDQTVIALDQGPCQDVLPTGATLVDANQSGTELTVTTTPPLDWLHIVAMLSAAAFLFRRRK